MAVVPEDEMVDALVEWAEFIAEHGVEAALARADTAEAAREAAERDRAALLAEQGDDANAQRAARRADPQARLTPTHDGRRRRSHGGAARRARGMPTLRRS